MWPRRLINTQRLEKKLVYEDLIIAGVDSKQSCFGISQASKTFPTGFVLDSCQEFFFNFIVNCDVHN